MSVMWTPLRLTMSSSPQISKRDSPAKTTSSSQGKLNSFIYTSNRLQEETILEKQTVRISPSLYKRNVPVSTFFMNGHHKCGDGVVSDTQSDEIRNSPQLSFADSATAANDYSSAFTNSKLEFAHKECQTETSTSMANCTDDRVRPENDHVDTSAVVHEKENVSELPEHDHESKDRELEHIDAIVSESKYASKTSIDGIDTVDQPKQNGSAFSSKTKNVTESEFKKNVKQLPVDEEEEDSCCMNCFLVTLNVCECVIL